MTMDLVYGVGFGGGRFISDPIGELGRSASLFHKRLRERPYPVMRSGHCHASGPTSCSSSLCRSCRKTRARVGPIPPSGISTMWARFA